MIKNIYCMIPAREGSVRLKYKNLALINNKALIEYSILNAKKTNIFKTIHINSDSKIYEYFSQKHQIDFYKRKKKFATSSARSDDVIYDFINGNQLENGLLVWLNPIAPLLTPILIKEVLKEFAYKKLSSTITANERKVHTIYNLKNLNFNNHEKFAKTQDLEPVYTFNYAMMIWDIHKFKKQYNEKGHCIFIDKFYPITIPEHNSYIVKTAYDLKIVENFLNYEKKLKKITRYHYQIKKIHEN